jgi:hypothetical protein
MKLNNSFIEFSQIKPFTFHQKDLKFFGSVTKIAKN